MADAEESVKHRARMLVMQAVRSGRLLRPTRCPLCYRNVDRNLKPIRISAHHEDYSKPLDVIWCCGHCHSRLDVARWARLGLPNKQKTMSWKVCMRRGLPLPKHYLRGLKNVFNEQETKEFIDRFPSQYHEQLKEACG